MTMRGIDRIKHERIRQVDEEGYTLEGDKGRAVELIKAGSCYQQFALMQLTLPEDAEILQSHPADIEWEDNPLWPWARDAWKPSTPERNIEKAGALFAAALDAAGVE